MGGMWSGVEWRGVSCDGVGIEWNGLGVEWNGVY